jgi:hypothetical protein
MVGLAPNRWAKLLARLAALSPASEKSAAPDNLIIAQINSLLSRFVQVYDEHRIPGLGTQSVSTAHLRPIALPGANEFRL